MNLTEKMMRYLYRCANGHGAPHENSAEARRAYREGWVQVNPDWSGLTQLTDQGGAVLDRAQISEDA